MLPIEPIPPGWPAIAMAAGMVVAWYLVYRLRCAMRLLVYVTPCLIGIAGWLVDAARDYAQHGFTDPASALFLALFHGLPLAFGWGLAAAFFDPAYVTERWDSYNR